MMAESTEEAFKTGIPSSLATTATGDSVSTLFRPISASGLVSTKAMGTPDATSCRRVSAEFEGVPAKRMGTRTA